MRHSDATHVTRDRFRDGCHGNVSKILHIVCVKAEHVIFVFTNLHRCVAAEVTYERTCCFLFGSQLEAAMFFFFLVLQHRLTNASEAALTTVEHLGNRFFQVVFTNLVPLQLVSRLRSEVTQFARHRSVRLRVRFQFGVRQESRSTIGTLEGLDSLVSLLVHVLAHARREHLVTHGARKLAFNLRQVRV